MNRCSLFQLFFCAIVGMSCYAAATEPPPQVRDFFEAKIRPVLVEQCYQCHGPDEAASKLRLDSRQGWQRGGERGPAIVPGDPSASLLMTAISRHDDKLRMPPADAGEPLKPAVVEDFATWIRQGAYDPRDGQVLPTDIERRAREHWAFQPLSVPQFTEEEKLLHPIDALVERQLRGQQLRAVDAAPMPTLVRRLTYDLHGLPPTPEQLTTTADKWQDLVRDLLASPRYGERWGRHWLDVARYSDAKDGVLMYGDARIRPFAYTYRDYVIRAFNDDLPYDQFVRQQLAADQMQLAADAPELAAMGLLTLGRMFDRNLHDVVDDQIDVIGRGFLGLTIACARCHDHKFDPVPTADYYSLYGVLASCGEPLDRPRIEAVSAEGAAFEKEFAAKLKEVTDQQQQHYEEQLKIARQRTSDYLAYIVDNPPDVAETTIFFLSLTPEQLRPQITRRWRQLLARRAFPDDPVFGPWYDLTRELKLKPDEWRERQVDPRIVDALVSAQPTSMAEVARAYGQVMVQAWQAQSGAEDPLVQLLVSREGPVWFAKADIANYLSRQPGDKYRELLSQLDAIAVKHAQAPARAMVLVDNEVLCDPVIFQRGDPAQRGAPVPRQFLQLLSGSERKPFPNGSGRLNLADAIVSKDNPLLARVWVNRVWMHHFGEPLVENPSDFGLQTRRPVQLELLDYLAHRLMDSGWRTKALHTLIVTSKAYQRGSVLPADDWVVQQQKRDPDNHYLWRGTRRRLDWEQMRDSYLSIAGELDLTMGGRPRVVTDPENKRRTVYAFVERQSIPAEVQTFDFANADTSTARRNSTTVPQQALFAMNSEFVMKRAQALAARVTREHATDVVGGLMRVALGREPDAKERGLAEQFLVDSSLESLAHVVLMSNELMFVD